MASYFLEGKESIPLTAEDVKGLLDDGSIHSTTLLRREAENVFRCIDEFPELLATGVTGSSRQVASVAEVRLTADDFMGHSEELRAAALTTLKSPGNEHAFAAAHLLRALLPARYKLSLNRDFLTGRAQVDATDHSIEVVVGFVDPQVLSAPTPGARVAAVHRALGGDLLLAIHIGPSEYFRYLPLTRHLVGERVVVQSFSALDETKAPYLAATAVLSMVVRSNGREYQFFYESFYTDLTDIPGLDIPVVIRLKTKGRQEPASSSVLTDAAAEVSAQLATLGAKRKGSSIRQLLVEQSKLAQSPKGLVGCLVMILLIVAGVFLIRAHR